jgi:hypothetical protein
MFWERLEDSISSFTEEKPQYEHLVYKTEEGTMYSLGSYLLERFAQLVLATKQVLDGLCDFLGYPERNCFALDPNWQMLRLMEFNASRNSILIVFATLQYCLSMASKRVQKYLHSIRVVYGQEGLDMLSSLDSTRSSVCSEFG